MATATIDPVMGKIRAIWAQKQAAGWTLADLGAAMGFDAESAKQSAHQFLRGGDPRASSIRRFARAVKVSPATLWR